MVYIYFSLEFGRNLWLSMSVHDPRNTGDIYLSLFFHPEKLNYHDCSDVFLNLQVHLQFFNEKRRFSSFFIIRLASAWNFLPAPVFPCIYDPDIFKVKL